MINTTRAVYMRKWRSQNRKKSRDYMRGYMADWKKNNPAKQREINRTSKRRWRAKQKSHSAPRGEPQK